MKHLVFYDGTCGLCDFFVQFLLRVDLKKQFVFAPLQGKTADELLQELPNEYREEDSLVLVEEYQSPKKRFFVLGKAALRIFWILGRQWTLIGWMNFLPSYPFDVIYRWVAKNRYRFFSKESCQIPNRRDQDRFLP